MSFFRQLPPELDRVVISVNPKAGRRDARPAADRLVELLRGDGLRGEVFTELNEAAQTAARWQAAGELRAVVAGGGDGTAAELVNRTPLGTPLSLLPLGTENLLAKYVWQGFQPEKVCRTIAGGLVAELDAGVATSTSPESPGERRSRVFLLMASAGLDADVVQRLEQSRAGHISHWSYLKPIWQAIRNYNYPPLRIDWVENPTGPGAPPHVARWLFLFNLPCYAWGLPFTPHARGDDSLFDLCTFQGGSLWHGLRYLAALATRRHARLRDCTVRRVTRVHVEADEPVPYQLDGDLGGFLPLEIEVLPRRLALLVPEEWARENGWEN